MEHEVEEQVGDARRRSVVRLTPPPPKVGFVANVAALVIAGSVLAVVAAVAIRVFRWISGL